MDHALLQRAARTSMGEVAPTDRRVFDGSTGKDGEKRAPTFLSEKGRWCAA